MRRLPFLLLTTTLALPAAGDAASPRWRQGWGLAETAAPATASDPAFARLQLQARAGGWAVIARNQLAGPVQVRLRGIPEGSAPPPRLLAAGEQRQLLWLAGDQPARLLLDAVPGDPAARAGDAVYQLPFAGQPVRVSQAIAGRHSHADAQNLHAVDFPLPEGTPVLAARPGRVMQVLRDDPADGNLVRLLHADGSMAVYAHLQAASLRVRPGQQVETGQVLAHSGNSGRSNGPHLHFAVQRNTGMALVSVPFRMVGPRGELRFPREAGAAPDRL